MCLGVFKSKGLFFLERTSRDMVEPRWAQCGHTCAAFLQQDGQYPPFIWWQSHCEVLEGVQWTFPAAGKQEPGLAGASPLSGDRLARLAGGEVGLSLSAGSYLFLLPLSAACNGIKTTELSSHFPLERETGTAIPWDVLPDSC